MAHINKYPPINPIDDEIWKPVVGFEGIYEVSNIGRVKLLYREYYPGDYPTKRVMKNKILDIRIRPDGYLTVWLSKQMRDGKHYFIHRLVSEAFINNFLNKKEVNHIDGHKTNNFVSNLEWATRSENIQHAVDNGLIKPRKGADNKNSRVLLDTKTGIFYECIREAADAKGYNKYTLTNKLSQKHGHRNTTEFIYA